MGLRVRCLAEHAPRGAVIDALGALAERFIVMYGDTVLDGATIFFYPNDHPHNSDIVEIDGEGFVRALHPYPHPRGALLPNLVNAALYVVERSALAALTDPPQKPDFAKHVFPLMLAQGVRLFGYRSPEHIKDAGTPERLAKAARDIESGRVAKPVVQATGLGDLSRSGRRAEREPRPCLAARGAAAVSRRPPPQYHTGYRSVVITNQPVIARGDYGEDELAAIHAKLDTLLAHDGAYIDRLYYCPHHPHAEYRGESHVSRLHARAVSLRPGWSIVWSTNWGLTSKSPGS
jgi:hypothetical protein